MILRLPALLLCHRMRVVETDQPPTIRPMQRERIIDAMRLLQRHRHPRHHEPDPMAALRVHHENLPVEVEKHIEGRITQVCHGILLSH